MLNNLHHLPALPQPRPSSGSSPSSRNRSVQRLRQAVSEVRQGWTTSSPSPIQGPRPMVVRMPLRARTPGPSSPSGGGDHLFGSGAGEGNSATQQQGGSSLLSPMPASPYGFFTGDPSPQAIAALCRGARIVRAHGLQDGGPNDVAMTNTQLFGAFSSSSPKADGRPPSGKRSGSGRRTPGGGRVSNADEVDTARLEKETEDERIARTAGLTAADVRPLMEPKSIYFVPGLLTSGPLPSQIADDFTAGNARRKLVTVLQRESQNSAALNALTRALKTVKEHDARIAGEKEEEAKRHALASEASGVAVASPQDSAADLASSPSGVGGRPARGSNKEKDPETLAAEAAAAAEAARVRAACELLRSAKLDGTNRCVLFARLRRVLVVTPPPSSSGNATEFAIPAKRLLTVLCDALDVASPSAVPCWESLAALEVQAAEAAKIARETKSYRRGGGGAAVATSSNMSSPMAAGGAGGANAADPLASSFNNNREDSGLNNNNNNNDSTGTAPTKADDEGGTISNASFTRADAMIAAASMTTSSLASPNANAAANSSLLLPFRWHSLESFVRNPQPGGAMRSLAEEFIIRVMEPGSITVARVLAECGFSAHGRSSGNATTTAWQPVLRVEQVSRLVDGLSRALKGGSTSHSLLDVVVTSAFNFVRRMVDARKHWTGICNSIEDVIQQSIARSAEVQQVYNKLRESSHQQHSTNHHHHHSLVVGSKSGVSPTSPSIVAPSATADVTRSPVRGGGVVDVSAAVSPSSAARGRSPTSHGNNIANSNDLWAAAEELVPEVPLPRELSDLYETSGSSPSATHHSAADPLLAEISGYVTTTTTASPARTEAGAASPTSTGGNLNESLVPYLPFISDRPAGMSKEFFELEYIGFKPFSELLQAMHDRHHIAGVNDQDDSESPDNNGGSALCWATLHSVCNGIQAAFRQVLQDQQLAQAMAGSRRKKVDPSTLPPVFPDKKTVLRLKDFREVFKSSEKVAGPMLPFVLAAFCSSVATEQDGAGTPSRWQAPVPLTAFL